MTLRLVASNPDAAPLTPAQSVIHKLRFAVCAARRFASEGDDMLKRSAFAELERKLEAAIDLLERREREAS